MRVGIGYDSHPFATGRKLILGGVEIPNAKGLAGHSDADAVAHAVTDAILGAISHVVTACEQRTPFEMDAEDGYRAIELCAAWKQSAATHEPVQLPL